MVPADGKERFVTTAQKIEEPMASMTPEEKEDAKKFLVFLVVLAVLGAIIAAISKRK